MMKGLSLVIPTYNEKGNIFNLIKRIHDSLDKYNIKYELIFIDDNSDDGTYEEIGRYSNEYPIQKYLKIGKKGKAYSLLEGFRHVKYDYIAIIDADLQYPPEALPNMYSQLRNYDIVVANRSVRETSFIRNFFSKGFFLIFGKLLHNLNVDVQSGLKIFKSEILEKLSLKPTQWTFDMEFLIKARKNGFKIGNYNINFSKRTYGKSKVSILNSTFEIGLSAIKLKFKNDENKYAFKFLNRESQNKGFIHKGIEYLTFNKFYKHNSALLLLNNNQKILLTLAILLLSVSLFFQWHSTLILLFSLITFLYLLDIIFYMYLSVKSLTKTPEVVFSEEEILSLENKNLPTYTIFCPLYEEWQVLPQFVNAMNKLDYPKDKLQILLLLEEDDYSSINKVNSMKLPFNFQVLIVPDSLPKTKPKACNFGLQYATGKYCVIYDAEDIPDTKQLKKAIIAFNKLPATTVCLQAKLNFYNPKQNLLTNLFTSEYSLWFDLILPGLQSINAPIPLGGTSNHFRTADLKSLNGWDAFNVTEDADLGIRLSNIKLNTAIIDSTTYEEANSNMGNWIGQRSRWIKGYLQTFLVHTRASILNKSLRELLLFQSVIGGKIFLLFINPIMWLITLLYFAFRPITGGFIESLFPTPIFYMGIFSLLIGNFTYLYSYMIACAKKNKYEFVKYTYLVPIYWMLMSVAAYIALYNLIKKPHHWFKTVHGFHISKSETI